MLSPQQQEEQLPTRGQTCGLRPEKLSAPPQLKKGGWKQELLITVWVRCFCEAAYCGIHASNSNPREATPGCWTVPVTSQNHCRTGRVVKLLV